MGNVKVVSRKERFKSLRVNVLRDDDDVFEFTFPADAFAYSAVLATLFGIMRRPVLGSASSRDIKTGLVWVQLHFTPQSPEQSLSVGKPN